MKLFELLDYVIDKDEAVEIVDRYSNEVLLDNYSHNFKKEELEPLEHREVHKIYSLSDLAYGSRIVIEVEEE